MQWQSLFQQIGIMFLQHIDVCRMFNCLVNENLPYDKGTFICYGKYLKAYLDQLRIRE